MSESNKQFAQ